MPRAEDRVQIGYWSLEEGKFYPVAETRAYNWQQGAQLQWLPPDYSTRIVFNDREGDRFVSRIVNIEDGTSRALPFPIYTVHPAGTSAVCVNCERSYFRRPGYNYQGVVKPEWDVPLHPDDGLFRLDLETGERQMYVIDVTPVVGEF
ncbi:MAG: hypothetical protein QF890_01460 [Myxococcota bacterium]|jgi:hypothetical protein|nr:hypothetical protein [Deltaproteobacteria bacterium]MCP4244364.1 hypothetical protein [bacterium]MDP6074850.1 hypothetical protein [Myxococcota bacterium]MDP6244670.1 hypothetical protein [Myxococcota bacterium]MDP7075241.1 hypothetical protein [Myxococcota bacterium]|tara:strand:- start:75 stop:515 length:441 start_codon:yes stop_codon:yes gene_type:complete